MLIFISILLLLYTLNLEQFVCVKTPYVNLQKRVTMNEVLDQCVHLPLDHQLHLAFSDRQREAHLYREGHQVKGNYFTLSFNGQGERLI